MIPSSKWDIRPATDTVIILGLLASAVAATPSSSTATPVYWTTTASTPVPPCAPSLLYNSLNSSPFLRQSLVRVCRRGNGGNLLQYLTKGTSVFVRGNLSAGTYTTRSGEVRVSLSVMVSEINLISSTRGQEERAYLDGARQLSQQQPVPPAPPVGAAPPAGAPPANDDDLPF